MEDKRFNRTNIMILVTVIAVIFLGLLAAFNYSGSSDAIFGLNNFYEGNQGEMSDPKAQYEALHKSLTANTNSCLTVMSPATSPKLCGKSYVWFVDGASIDKWSELKVLTMDDTRSTIKPFKSGDMIVSPSELKFINSNVVQYDTDTITIMASINDNYILEFSDVKTWWCHIGKAKQNRHTTIIGNGGVNPVCAEGYIIGEAKDSTTVTLYKVNATGSKEKCSFKDLFFSN